MALLSTGLERKTLSSLLGLNYALRREGPKMSSPDFGLWTFGLDFVDFTLVIPPYVLSSKHLLFFEAFQ